MNAAERPYAAQVHGALVEVLGQGVLLLGHSGVGKSECALQLIQRGHRLVADDVVRLSREDATPDRVTGHAPELIRHYMEIRGVGLVSILDLYGERAVKSEAFVDLICRLEAWRDDVDYERVGLDRARQTLVGLELPTFTLPLRPAVSMATVVELAVRDELSRRAGVNAAARLDETLRAVASTSKEPEPRDDD